MPDAIFRIDGVSFQYPGRARAGVYDIDLSLRRDETTVLMGPNGSGKTTLLRLCAGLLQPQRGQIQLLGEDGWRQIQRPQARIGYIPQQLGLLRARTVHENVLLGALGRQSPLRRILGTFPPHEEEAASAWIQRVGLAPKEDGKVFNLSGGERQRVAIARAMFQRPALLVADELVSSLDVARAADVLRLATERLHEGHVASLLTLHNPDLAARFGDRFIFIHEGRIVEDLPAKELTPEVVARRLGT